MDTQDQIDWSECPLVEMKHGVQSGAPVLRGTRMPVSAIVDNFDDGVSVPEIAEQFEVPADRVEAIVAHAQSHRVAHPVDKSVPVGVRRFLHGHDVRTFTEMQWHPQLENGELPPSAASQHLTNASAPRSTPTRRRPGFLRYRLQSG